MSRARNVKPGVMENERLAECQPMARLLFIYMWMLADRSGRLEDRPKRIRAQALPYDLVDAEPLLQELHDAGFIRRYVVDGAGYIQILKFEKHQTPHVKEKASTLPEYVETCAETVLEHEQFSASPAQAPDLYQTSTVQAPDNTDASTSVAPPDCLILRFSDSLIPVKTLKPFPENFGADVETESIEPLHEELPESPDEEALFDLFWSAGMRKVERKAAYTVFSRILKRKADKIAFVSVLVADIQERINRGQLGFDQLHPTTYLNGERWNDELPKLNGVYHDNNTRNTRNQVDEIDWHSADFIDAELIAECQRIEQRKTDKRRNLVAENDISGLAGHVQN